MALTRFKSKIVGVAIIVLAVGLTGLITSLLNGSSDCGRLRLPVGTGAPAISLGDLYGLILASDGSLWSWGSEKLGWPLLGLGGLRNRSNSRSGWRWVIWKRSSTWQAWPTARATTLR